MQRGDLPFLRSPSLPSLRRLISFRCIGVRVCRSFPDLPRLLHHLTRLSALFLEGSSAPYPTGSLGVTAYSECVALAVDRGVGVCVGEEAVGCYDGYLVATPLLHLGNTAKPTWSRPMTTG